MFYFAIGVIVGASIPMTYRLTIQTTVQNLWRWGKAVAYSKAAQTKAKYT